ncbi:MAG TPA: hypothetical protein VK756_03445 [Solirubrobacteraceae bacterium]|jgi:hypothetical protein|nr:hypothetical protein [Solirubrobacteraceae bacterium]
MALVGSPARRSGLDRADADLWARRRLAGATYCSTPAQRPAVLVSPGGLGADPAILPVDLPVDGIVVLEQEECAGQRERLDGVLRERRCCL